MKNPARQTFLVFLASLILFTSTGFGLVEHSCSMRGKKTYSFVTKEMDKSCDHQQKTPSGKTTISRTKCCTDKQTEKKENLSESVTNLGGKLIKAVTQLFVKLIVWTATLIFEAIQNILGFDNEEPSTLFGKELLHFISLLRL